VDRSWAEASIWTERMSCRRRALSARPALDNGVVVSKTRLRHDGGKWFSLIDKVMAPKTLELAWQKVRANKGAAGVDGLSIGRFAAKAEEYLSELATALRGRAPTDRRPSSGWTSPRAMDTIPHERLMARVEEKVSDGRLLDLIRAWLKADILKGLERWTPTGGTPRRAGSAPSARRGVLSPLLANIYLDPLDRLMAERGYRMVRYADDFVILTRSREEADAALALVAAWVAENGLTLHPEKTRVGGRVEDARFQHDRQPGEGFEFLGYRFEAGRRDVRKKSFVRVKDMIREKTRRRRGDSLECVIADLNRTLQGWFGYFKHARPFTFAKLDGMIRRRLRAYLRKQEKRPGLGICRADHRRWANAFFANAGLFALHTAWQAARQSR
jgi:hypothetical protein